MEKDDKGFDGSRDRSSIHLAFSCYHSSLVGLEYFFRSVLLLALCLGYGIVVHVMVFVDVSNISRSCIIYAFM